MQMDAELEWRMWTQIKGAFFLDPSQVAFMFVPVVENPPTNKARHFETMEEALAAAPSGSRVFLEPGGTKTLSELPTGDLVVVLGNTSEGNAEHAAAGETYRIQSPGRSHLYGVNAAALALGVRHGQ